MWRKVIGIWTPLPFCHRNFGSCVFQDVCRYGRPEPECPPLLDEHDVPCECPIEKVKYNTVLYNLIFKYHTIHIQHTYLII